jgi:CDP-glucose 4,6-dehydratase
LLYESGPAYAEGWNFGPNDEDAMTVGWIVDRMAGLWGSEARWEIDQGEHPHEANWLKLDTTKARSRLGWHPALSLDDALALVVAWSRERRGGANVRELTLVQISDYQRLTQS